MVAKIIMSFLGVQPVAETALYLPLSLTHSLRHLYIRERPERLVTHMKKTSDAGDIITANFLDFPPNLGIFRPF